MSKSEEELILKGWEQVIKKTIWDDIYFDSFGDNLELAAQLLQDSGFEKEGAFKKAAHYLFYARHEFEPALDFLLKTGLSMKDAVDVIYEPMRVSGSGGLSFVIGHEEKMIAFMLRTGKTKNEALDFVAAATAYHHVLKLMYDDPSAEEAVRIVKEAEQKVMGYVKDEKWTAKVMGRAFLRIKKPFRAVVYLEKAGDQELLKETYRAIGLEYFSKDDYQNALKYYEKSGDTKRIEEIKEYIKKTGKQ